MVRYYIITDLQSPQGREVTATQLVKYSKEMLQVAKRNGYDLEFKSKDIKDDTDAIRYLKDFANIPVKKGRLPKNRQWIVVDENLNSQSGLGGVTKEFATKLAKELNKASKNKNHRMYLFTKGHKYTIERYVR